MFGMGTGVAPPPLPPGKRLTVFLFNQARTSVFLNVTFTKDEIMVKPHDRLVLVS